MLLLHRIIFLSSELKNSILMTSITLRIASFEDSEDIYSWRINHTTRSMSNDTSEFSYDEHCRWFNSILSNGKSKIFIGIKNNEKFGMCRFDHVPGNQVFVSINLNPEYRGQNLSKTLLMSSIEKFRSKENHPLFAEIKAENIISQKVFVACHFVFRENRNNIFLYEFSTV